METSRNEVDQIPAKYLVPDFRWALQHRSSLTKASEEVTMLPEGRTLGQILTCDLGEAPGWSAIYPAIYISVRSRR